MKGVNLARGDFIGLDMFVDDSNALMANDPDSISCFQECVNIYCKASCSVINHKKTGIKCMIEDPPAPLWLLEVRCRPLEEGQIFRLLGIPIKLGISLK